MELTQENIEKLAGKLTIGKLEESTEVMQSYFLIAEKLIKDNPDKTIEEIAKKTGETKKATEETLNAFISVVTEALKENKKVQLVGFGSFEVRKRAARKGRNPQTREEIKIPASKAPVFKAGKALKDVVNG